MHREPGASPTPETLHYSAEETPHKMPRTVQSPGEQPSEKPSHTPGVSPATQHKVAPNPWEQSLAALGSLTISPADIKHYARLLQTNSDAVSTAAHRWLTLHPMPGTALPGGRLTHALARAVTGFGQASSAHAAAVYATAQSIITFCGSVSQEEEAAAAFYQHVHSLLNKVI